MGTKIKLKPRAAHQDPIWPDMVRRIQERVSSPPPVTETEESGSELWGIHSRTIITILRTMFFGGMLVFVASRSSKVVGEWDAAVWGGMFADYVTWFIWSFLMLPRHLMHGAYEAGLNIFLGILFSRAAPLDFHGDDGGNLLACFAIAFLLVFAVKLCCLSVTWAEEMLNDDD